MIHPTCSEVLATIGTGFEREIVPYLADPGARSAAATISHLLRHVALRIEEEGQVLLDDIDQLGTLLGQIAEWLDATGTADADAIRQVLGRSLPEGTYPSLALLGERSLALREALVDAQQALHRLKKSHADDPSYLALRQAIRDYIAAQLDDEATLVVPAFKGKGPRR